jgi:excisionase family DNA binding protein
MTRDGDKSRGGSPDIYKWAQEKRIPAAKVGKEWRFRKSIVDRWLDEQILNSESGFDHLKK